MEVTYTKAVSFDGVVDIDYQVDGALNISIVAYDAYGNERVVAIFTNYTIKENLVDIPRIIDYYKRRYVGGKYNANNNTNGY